MWRLNTPCSHCPYICLARVVYSVRGWDLSGALFEGGVLGGQKGTEFRVLLDTVENSRKRGVTIVWGGSEVVGRAFLLTSSRELTYV